MARKTFISYKYSEARDTRDDILDALGEDATYYTGETSDSPDLGDLTTESIKENLKDMMYGTSVTIVVVSPNFSYSQWIDWEIEYCLKEISRQDRTSKTNGVVGVVQELDDGYDWLITSSKRDCGCNVRTIDQSYLYKIINDNRFNRKPAAYSCDDCKTYDQLTGSFISLVEENRFLANPDKFIENAFDKAEYANNYELVKQRS